MDRRKFILIAASLALFGQKGLAYPLDKILGDPSADYVQEYIRRYWDWYQRKWFDFSKHMNKQETQLFKFWLRQVPSFTQKSQNYSIENFLTCQHLIASKKFYGRYYCGLTNWNEEGQSLFKKFLSSRISDSQMGLLPLADLYGWSQNFDEKLLKVWLKQPKQKDFPNLNFEDNPVLGFIEFGKLGETRRGVVHSVTKSEAPMTSAIHPKLILSAFKVTDSTGISRWKYRTSATYLPNLKDGALWLATKHRLEFRHSADLLEIGDDEVKLYYP